MATIFVAHPISGDVEGNLEKVDEICKAIYEEGHIPIFPSHIARRYLDDEPELRELCDKVNEEYFKRGMIDEVWVYGDHLDEEMRSAILLSQEFGVKLFGKTPESRRVLDEMHLRHYMLLGDIMEYKKSMI